MSKDGSLPPEAADAMEALAELEQVLSHLREGVADWRRRALKAEAESAALGDGLTGRTAEDLRQVEADNADLHQRLEATRVRVQDLLSRLRFLEEQVALEEQRS
jgi:hypothetical protein